MTRQEKLQALIDSPPFNGSQAAFARAIKRSPAQVGQWLSGHRGIGDAGARLIEIALHLPQGYFDGGLIAAEPRQTYAVNVAPLPQREPTEIAEVVKMMKATDDKGRAMALAAVRVALDGYQPAKANLHN